MAMVLHVKVKTGPASAIYVAVPATTNISKLLTQEDNRIAPNDDVKQAGLLKHSGQPGRHGTGMTDS